MRAYNFGEPTYSLIGWALNIRRRWLWTRFILIVPVALIFLLFAPLAWALFKLGVLGARIAFALGIDPYDIW